MANDIHRHMACLLISPTANFVLKCQAIECNSVIGVEDVYIVVGMNVDSLYSESMYVLESAMKLSHHNHY